MSERKLTLSKTRKPKKTKIFARLIDEIAEDTGFSKTDIKVVVHCFCKKLKEAILTKHKVSIPGIGLMFPTIRRGKDVSKSPWAQVSQQIWSGSRWVLKIRYSQSMDDQMRKMEVTPVEERKMFYGY